MRCLCGFVEAIRKSLRGYDLVGRYGGEEFLVVAPDAAGSATDDIYERLRFQIEQLKVATRFGDVNVTVSIGVAGTENGNTVDTLIAKADAALYRAKRAGRNRVVYAAADERGRRMRTKR